ncbi:glutathione S-transferase family protein [Marinicella sp. W31]|uniref:glutathione S-transferase family protein n=1 Tax=Marinicella sp. W31 TaxID=3023713 RepID=UPI0037571CE0
MSITVYSVSGAPRAWRVLLGLAFKGLDYDVEVLQVSKNEHKSPEYLKINPRGTIPALEYQGLILRDSIGILAWLDRQFPDTPLFGATPDEAATIWQNTLEACDYLRSTTNEVLFSIMVEGKPVADVGTAERENMISCVNNLKKEYQHLENFLDSSDYLSGDNPSATDAVCFPEIRLLERAIDTKFTAMKTLGLDSFAKDFPKLEAWKERISNLPNVDKTMPPHWSETPEK